MFVRVKRIKGNEYLYLVENKWSKGKVKQKVKDYIGRVYDFEKDAEYDYFEFYRINDVSGYLKKGREEIVKDLVRWEIMKRGFEGKNLFKRDNVIVDLNNLRVLFRKRDAAIKINDGYIYSKLLKEIVRFKPGRDKERSGLELAQMFVNAGIEVPQEIFVGLIIGNVYE